MGRTVGNLVGIQPDYVFVTRFPFFEDMVDDIGGIDVDNPRPFSDPYLKPKGFQAGRIHLNGYGAMAFSRIRKTLPGGDFDRSANQQRILRGIQAKIRADAADEPGFIERGRDDGAAAHGTPTCRPAELFRLAQAVAQVEPGEDHHLRGARRDRQRRRRQRGVPRRRHGPPLRRRRPRGRDDPALLTRCPGVCKGDLTCGG